MKALRSENGWINASLQVPQLGHSVIYRTSSHQALGFVDPTGRWMSFEGRVEPEKVVAWIEPKQPVNLHHNN